VRPLVDRPSPLLPTGLAKHLINARFAPKIKKNVDAPSHRE
jgi:hypothetical protein